MGILTHKCPNEDCDARVLKQANHCSACGWAGKGSITNCIACDKRVGRASKFCWSCGSDISDNLPPRIQRDRWVRDDEEFAVRVYPDDLSGFLKRKVKIDPGTLGLIEKGGRIKKDIEWGQHTLDSVFKLTQPTSIILVNAADAMLRVDFEDLQDFHGVKMGCTLQVFIGIGDYEDFVSHTMEGGKRRVTERMLEVLLCDGLYDAVQDVMAQDSLENMYENMWWRGQLEEEVRSRFTRTLTRYGLRLSQISFVNFSGENFETLRSSKGENYMGNRAAEEAAAKMELRKWVSQIDADGKLGEYTTAASMADDMAAHDSRIEIKSILRAEDVKETLEAALQEARLKQQLRDIESQEIDREHDRGIILEDDELRRQLEKIQFLHVEDLEGVNSRIRTERLGQETLEAKARIEIEGIREDAALDRRIKEKTAGTQSVIDLQKANSDAQVAALKSISDGEMGTTQIEAEAKVRIAESTSAKDTAVAQAIAEQQEKRIQDMKDSNESMKDVSMRTVDAIAAAKTPDWSIGRSGRGGPAGDLSPCPKCHTDVSAEASFCERCGHDFRSSNS